MAQSPFHVLLRVYLVGLLNVAHLKVEAAGGGQQGGLSFSMVYLVGLLDVAHLKVEAAGGGQQGGLPLFHFHTLQQAQALDTHKLQHK